MSEEELARVVRMFKVLADESRLRILGALSAGPKTASDLADAVELRASTLSHHLTRLRESGLITVEKDGTSRIYTLNRETLAAVANESMSPSRIAAIAPPAKVKTYSERVLSTFLDQGHLTRIPASRKKRDVVLAWLATHFDIGEPVSESLVNDRIQAVHWDSATLRRELVGGGWMNREAGIYTRVR